MVGVTNVCRSSSVSDFSMLWTSGGIVDVLIDVIVSARDLNEAGTVLLRDEVLLRLLKDGRVSETYRAVLMQSGEVGVLMGKYDIRRLDVPGNV